MAGLMVKKMVDASVVWWDLMMVSNVAEMMVLTLVALMVDHQRVVLLDIPKVGCRVAWMVD